MSSSRANPESSDLAEQARTALYYDTIAPEYDVQVDALASNRTARDLFVDRVSAWIRPRGRIVDFGCGTGTDTATYVGRGHPVVAYDVSPRMAALLGQRCAEPIASGLVISIVGPAKELWDHLERTGPADALVANFAVFNHIRDLRSVFHAAAAHLAPDGVIVAQMLNPFCWSDVRRGWWWRAAGTSLGSGAVILKGRDTTTYRHFPWTVRRAAADFALVEQLGATFRSQFSIFVFRRRR